MGYRKYCKSAAAFLVFTLLFSGSCPAEEPYERDAEKQAKKEDKSEEERARDESPDTYRKGLLDKVVSRGEIATEEKSTRTEYETFDERLQKEKEKQRIEDIGEERKRGLKKRIELIY